MTLSPQQFKMSLGEHHDRAADALDDYKRERGDPAGGRPATGDAPLGYYNQPSANTFQRALPGMEMSVQDHLDALGKATGTNAGIDSGRVSHRIRLVEDAGDRWGGVERSHLSYNGDRPDAGHRDSGQVVGNGSDAYHPGEIRMIKSGKPGDASAMLETAERLATEHGFSFPKHSWSRTPEGIQWSQKQMAKRGERVW